MSNTLESDKCPTCSWSPEKMRKFIDENIRAKYSKSTYEEQAKTAIQYRDEELVKAHAEISKLSKMINKIRDYCKVREKRCGEYDDYCRGQKYTCEYIMDIIDMRAK